MNNTPYGYYQARLHSVSNAVAAMSSHFSSNLIGTWIMPSKEQFLCHMSYKEVMKRSPAGAPEKRMEAFITFNMWHCFDSSSDPSRRRRNVWLSISAESGLRKVDGVPMPATRPGEANQNVVKDNSFPVIQHIMNPDNDYNGVIGNAIIRNSLVPSAINQELFQQQSAQICQKFGINSIKDIKNMALYTKYESEMVNAGYLIPSDILEIPSNALIPVKMLDPVGNQQEWIDVSQGNPLTYMSFQPSLYKFHGAILIDDETQINPRLPNIKLGLTKTRPNTSQAKWCMTMRGILLANPNDREGAEVIIDYYDSKFASQVTRETPGRVHRAYQRLRGKKTLLHAFSDLRVCDLPDNINGSPSFFRLPVSHFSLMEQSIVPVSSNAGIDAFTSAGGIVNTPIIQSPVANSAVAPIQDWEEDDDIMVSDADLAAYDALPIAELDTEETSVIIEAEEKPSEDLDEQLKAELNHTTEESLDDDVIELSSDDVSEIEEESEEEILEDTEYVLTTDMDINQMKNIIAKAFYDDNSSVEIAVDDDMDESKLDEMLDLVDTYKEELSSLHSDIESDIVEDDDSMVTESDTEEEALDTDEDQNVG
jgi:hypothetical protein